MILGRRSMCAMRQSLRSMFKRVVNYAANPIARDGTLFTGR
jgi:hypothetical protein